MTDREKEDKFSEKHDSSNSLEGADLPDDDASCGGSECGQKPFRAHPAFRRKERRSGKFGNLRQSSKNPLMNIVEQHEHARHRVAKITVAVFVLMVIAVLIHLGLEYAGKRRALREKIEDVESRIAEIDKKIEVSEKYEKSKAILKAIEWIEHGRIIDISSKKWDVMRDEYLLKLEESRPYSKQHFIVGSAAVDMVNIPQSRFFMGRQDLELGDDDELPRRAIILNYEFWLSRTEITNGQLRRFFPQHHSRIPGWEMYEFNRQNQPATYLDWHAASLYCELVTAAEEKAGRLPDDYEYRLPTEAEWEYACRGGTDTYYYWGNEFGESGAEYANILDLRAAKILKWGKRERGMPAKDGYIVTAPVGQFKPNAFGLHDMIGNVWEWCLDWYNPNAYRELYMVAPVQDEPVVATIERTTYFDRRYDVKSTSKVIRGGSWGNVPSMSRAATRDSAVPETKNSGIGFRMALAPKLSLISRSFSEGDDDVDSLE